MTKDLVDRQKLLNILNVWDPNHDIVPQFVWDSINGLSSETAKPEAQDRICSGYHNGRCWGTSERIETDCEGDIWKCGFYMHHPLTELYELKKEMDREEEKQ